MAAAVVWAKIWFVFLFLEGDELEPVPPIRAEDPPHHASLGVLLFSILRRDP